MVAQLRDAKPRPLEARHGGGGISGIMLNCFWGVLYIRKCMSNIEINKYRQHLLTKHANW